jgi:dolichyl-phosphate beta-glucosyltransferase
VSTGPRKELSIVIPAYNERTRLPPTLLALLQAEKEGVLAPAELREIVIVDDGSKDGTLQAIPAPVHERGLLRTVRLERNSGKGAAVRRGLAEARGEWVLVADADMATPWTQLRVLCARQAESGSQIVIGSRGLRDSALLRRQNPVRETLGKLFNRFIVLLTGLRFKDTQCGFKLIHRPSVEPWLGRLAIDRFAWDVEFLMRAMKSGLRICEVPVVWSHQDGSSVRPLRDGIRMVVDFTRIRLRMLFER